MLYAKIQSSWNNWDIFSDSIVEIVDFANSDKGAFPFLSSIDYYWVTIFSYKQIHEYVLPELTRMTDNNFNLKELWEKFKIFSEGVRLHQWMQIIWD